MVQAYSWTMASIFQGVSAKAWDNELWVWTLKGRCASSMSGWPDNGPLPYFDVDVQGELESNTDLDIVWEHWSNGIVPGSQGLTQAVQKDMVAAAMIFWNTVRTTHTNQYALSEIRIQANDAAGKSVGGSNKFTLKVPSAGGAAAAMPPNTALCISTESNSPTRRGHGRFFLGGLAVNILGTEGLVASSPRTTYLNATKTLLQSIVDTNQAVPAVIRTADRSFWDITGVRIGDELDVQNRRRNARREVYAQADLA